MTQSQRKNCYYFTYFLLFLLFDMKKLPFDMTHILLFNFKRMYLMPRLLWSIQSKSIIPRRKWRSTTKPAIAGCRGTVKCWIWRRGWRSSWDFAGAVRDVLAPTRTGTATRTASNIVTVLKEASRIATRKGYVKDWLWRFQFSVMLSTIMSASWCICKI